MSSRRQPAVGIARLRAREPTTGITRRVTITARLPSRFARRPRYRNSDRRPVNDRRNARVTGAINSCEKGEEAPAEQQEVPVTSEAVRAKGRRPVSEATAFRIHSLNRCLNPLLST